jgi:hypothetical protein
MTEFKMTEAELWCDSRLAKNVRQLEIRPEAAAEILQRATDLGGKVFYIFRGF